MTPALPPNPFVLDPTLDADSLPLCQLPLCHVRLMDDARYPWLILVPNQPDLAELTDLSRADRHRLMDEVAQASAALQALFGPDKLNVAALGNRVRQLHVHVIARFVSDAAWPGPVWGVGEAVPYPPHVSGMLIDRLAAHLGGSDDVQP